MDGRRSAILNRTLGPELSQLESRSQAVALKRGRIRWWEDRRVTRIRDTRERMGQRNVTPPGPTRTLVQAHQNAGGGWNSAADGCKSPMTTKGGVKPWNIIAYPRSGTDLRPAPSG